MKFLISHLIFFTFFVNILYADTTLSRDGNGQNVQGFAFNSIKSTSLGTKGFKCFSTAGKLSWGVKVTNGIDGTSIPFKYFYNENETTSFPVSDVMFQWQNSPISKSTTITKVCMRVYSSSTQKVGHGIFQ